MSELIEKLSQNSTKLAVFNAVRLRGKATASEVESGVQSSKPTILKYLDELVVEGLLAVDGKTKSSVGRPSKIFSVNASAAFAVGVDFGAPDLTFAMIDLAKNVVDRRQVSAALEEPPLSVARKIIQGIEEMANANSVSLKEQMLGVGIGIPCWIDHRSELILPVPQLPHWESVPLRTIMERAMDLPAYIRTGPRLMALGERTFDGDDEKNMLYIHIRQSIGMGAYVDGMLLRGSRWGASKLGHTIVCPDGPACICGKRGCLEVFASETAMVEKARELMNPEVTVQELFSAVRDEDTVARRVVGNALDYLAIAIINAIEFFDPELIVLGGNIAQCGDFVIRHLRRGIEELGLDLLNRSIELRLSRLELYAGSLGAADLALEKACGMFPGRDANIES